MSQYVIYSGESSMCTGEECIFHYLAQNVLNISVKSTWSIVSFKAIVFLLIFCLDDVSIALSEVLKSPTIMVLSMSFLMFVIN